MKFVAVAAILVAGALVADYSGSYVVPLEDEAIQYSTRPVEDPVALLQRDLAAGKTTLSYDENTGYLKSVLDALRVPVESQVLVFSKTSFQAARIYPATPRALYFNDAIAIGFVRGGDVLELTSTDPRQGTMFYTLEQEPGRKPRFERQGMACLQCHISGATAGVPGLVIRSVYPQPNGMPLFHAGGFITDHRSPLKERWGGWYVTGKHGAQQTHMGNGFVRDPEQPDKLDMEGTQNLTSLGSRVHTDAYLSPHSDIVALMVLEHQTRMTNLFTRLNYEARMAMAMSAGINKALGRPENELSESSERRIASGVETILEYMLFSDEAPLTEPVSGTSGFEKVFSQSGPLRELDLKTRLLKYPCSYLIYSPQFDALPAPAKERLYKRLFEVLTGKDQSKKFAHLRTDQRSDILGILRNTKQGLPEYWN